MARKTGLGKGLDALIPRADIAEETDRSTADRGIAYISVEKISPNPRQPRGRIDQEDLAELAASIRENGVIQPLIVTHDEEIDQYILIAGERRMLAARQADLKVVPAIIREVSEQQRLELALVENIQRSDLTALEAADAYSQLVDDFGLSHEEIAVRLGKSRVAVTNTLRLLKLSDPVKTALNDGKIREGHARALLSLQTDEAQTAILHTILKNGLNVRQTEEVVRRLSGEKPGIKEKTAPSPEIIALEDRLRGQLGTKVRLNPRKKGGTLVIHYYSDEELNALVARILGEEN
jgi:ParB family chromosome partitioning protein